MQLSHTGRLRNEISTVIDRISLINPQMAAELNGLKLDWYRIVNQAEEPETAHVYIYAEIGGSFGVDASQFVEELNAITASTINVHINSRGGSLFDGIAIHNALRSHPANVISKVESLAASIASVIALGGNEVIMLAGSQMMIHDALAAEIGNERDFIKMAAFLGRQSDNIASIYRDRAGGTVDEWRQRMLDETWFFADEAVEIGLADRVERRESKDDDDESTEEQEEETETVTSELDIDALMKITHDLSNFKYPGRENAPAPPVKNYNPDALTDILLSTLRG